MATGRKMDKHLDELTALEMLNAEAKELRKQLAAVEEQQKLCRSKIVKQMVNSTVGLIDGVPYFEIEDTERRTITMATAVEVCPDLLPQLVTVHHGKKIKFLK